jgi:branched-chain amino acid transport system ATP-binding protein
MSLELKNLSAAYDGYPVIRDFSLKVNAADAAGITGPNGAGKSTLMKAVMSLTPNKWGKVTLFGEDVTDLPPYELVRRGVTLIPEGRQVFTKMTVLENLEVGAYMLRPKALLPNRLEFVSEIVPFLRERQKQLAGSLSGGEQQLLVIARGLMSAPKVLLIDEPFLGLSPASIDLVRRAIDAIKRSGVGLLISEEDPSLLEGMVNQFHDISRSTS